MNQIPAFLIEMSKQMHEQIALMDSPPEESKILGKPEYWFNYVFD